MEQLFQRSLVAFSTALFAMISLRLLADEVHRFSAKAPLRGKITAETSTTVKIKVTQTGKTEEVEVPVNDVAKLYYEGPGDLALRTATGLERAGEFQKALDQFEKARGSAGENAALARAIRFGRVRTLAKRALQDPKRAAEAIQSLQEFRKEHADSRFHFELHELLGRLHMGQGKADLAREAIAELAKAPWPELRMRAVTWEGRVLLKAGDYKGAQEKFTEVASGKATTEAEKVRQQEALVSKAECQVLLKEHSQAEELLRQVIAAAPAEAAEVQAVACNLLGDALRETGRPKEALLAYLNVDVLYSSEKEAHAKALYYIALLGPQVGRSAEAADSREKLKRLYPASTWTTELAKAGS